MYIVEYFIKHIKMNDHKIIKRRDLKQGLGYQSAIGNKNHKQHKVKRL